MKNLCIPGVRLEYFDTIDSTNSEAKRRLGAVPPGEYRLFHKTVLVAGEQTAGRGRLGRKFYSPGGTGLYFSLVYAAGSVSDPGKITAVAAVAAAGNATTATVCHRVVITTRSKTQCAGAKAEREEKFECFHD